MTYRVDAVISELTPKKAGMKCAGKAGLIKLLESLGFDIEAKGTAGHKVYLHPHIVDFPVSSFDCGHAGGKKAHGKFIRPVYIIKVIKNLKTHREELISFEMESE